MSGVVFVKSLPRLKLMDFASLDCVVGVVIVVIVVVVVFVVVLSFR